MNSKTFKRIVLAAINSALNNEESYLDAIAGSHIDRGPTVKLIKDLKLLRETTQTHNIILSKP